MPFTDNLVDTSRETTFAFSKLIFISQLKGDIYP